MKNTTTRATPILLALWLGSALAVSFVAIPVVFDPDTRAALPAEAVGRVAQSILGRFFWVQLVLCGLGLLARLGAGGRWARWERFAWGLLGLGSLLAAFWLHPKLRELHRVKYDPRAAAETRAAAAASFRGWHGGSQAGNLVLLLTLGALVVAGGPRTPRGSPNPANSEK